eukprot:m.204509 g.204509  ORF g.204509 m.204509 type:complete len:965 (+) comp39649_c0_seq9:56-2950(+)
MASVVLLSLALLISFVAAVKAASSGAIWYQREEHLLAAKEVRRYLYYATGYWLQLHDQSKDLAALLQKQDNVVVLHEHNPPLKKFVGDLPSIMKEQGYMLKSTHHHALSQIFAIGGGSVGVLYAAYALAEEFGVRFRIYGDIIPDAVVAGERLKLPKLNELSVPAFEIRGLQPFHDFPEGPDWWGENEYKAITTQLRLLELFWSSHMKKTFSKQKMNFIGLHTYPYSSTPGTGRDEPTVWVGLKTDLNDDGTVRKSYPTSYANTMRNQWGYTALPTGNYSYGASQIFDEDCYGSPVQANNCPLPTTPEGSNAVFDKTGAMLKASFEHAQKVHVKTCIGTETPLAMPQPSVTSLNLYYSKQRRDNFLTTTECAECIGLYEFVRVEGFVYSDSFPGSMALNTYYSGQLQDNVLSSKPPGEGYILVRTEGYAFSNSSQFPSRNLSTLKMYYNAELHDHLSAATSEGEAYAKSQGYTFLGSIANVINQAIVPSAKDFYEGIFTRIQRLEIPLDYYWIWTPEGWEWSKMNSDNPVFKAAVNDLAAAAEARNVVNASFQLATCGWVVGPLPDRSIFDKFLSSNYSAITSIDMQVGNTPVDPAYSNITKHDKWAIPWMEDDPGLTAPQLWVNRTLQHMEDAKKYGCQGLLGIHWRTRQTSPQIAAMAQKSWDFSLTSETFWNSWCIEEFGIADPATIFSAIDSFNMPRPVSWSGGPGGWGANLGQCSWGPKYDFIGNLSMMKNKVKPNSSYMDRFEYWLNSFFYMRSISVVQCIWGQYNVAIEKVEKEKDPSVRQKMAETLALPLRVQLVKNATQMMSYLLQTVSSTGEMGTIMNVLSHSLVHAIEEPAAQLESYLGRSLTGEAVPSKVYLGPTKLIVPTVRTVISKGENFTIVAIVLSPLTVQDVVLYWRPMTGGNGSYSPKSFNHLKRNVFEVNLSLEADTEYYVAADVDGEREQHWPPGNSTQSVVVM